MKQKRFYQTPVTDVATVTNECVMAASVGDFDRGKRYDAGDDLASPATGGGIPLGMGGGGIGSLLKMTRTLLPLLCLGLATASCSNDSITGEEPTPAPEPTEKLVTLTVTAGTGADATTRTDYDDSKYKTDGTGYDGIEVTWYDGVEEFIGAVRYYDDDAPTWDAVDDDSNSNYTFSGTGSGTKSMDFTGTISASTGTLADKYSFYYPAIGSLLYVSPSYELTGQTQNGNGSTAHLKDFDVMYTPEAVTATTGGTSASNPFKFAHAAALLRFDFTLPENAAINKVEVATADDDPAPEAFYNYVTLTFNNDETGSITAGVDEHYTTNSLTLSISPYTAANTLRAYLMVAPTTLIKGKTLNITASTASGTQYTTTATIGNGDDDGFLAGKTYTFARDAAVPGDLTTIDPPLFAGSNIYWNGYSLTFDDADDQTNGHYQGVLFKWGSLVGISPSSNDVNANEMTAYFPTYNATTPEYSTWDNTTPRDYSAISPISDNLTGSASVNYFTTLDETKTNTLYGSRQGDICLYLTKTGAAPAGTWRMPTAEELELYTAFFTKPDDETFEAKSDTYADGTTAMPALLFGGKNYFPASGNRGTSGSLSNVGTQGRYWAADPDDTRSFYMLFGSGFSSVQTGSVNRSYAYSVRCVKDVTPATGD